MAERASFLRSMFNPEYLTWEMVPGHFLPNTVGQASLATAYIGRSLVRLADSTSDKFEKGVRTGSAWSVLRSDQKLSLRTRCLIRQASGPLLPLLLCSSLLFDPYVLDYVVDVFSGANLEDRAHKAYLAGASVTSSLIGYGSNVILSHLFLNALKGNRLMSGNLKVVGALGIVISAACGLFVDYLRRGNYGLHSINSSNQLS